MQTFLRRLGTFLLGFLCGFDRLRFRGSKRQLCYPNGIVGFLQHRGIAFRDFKPYALDVTESLFQAIEPPAKQAGIYRYLNSNHLSPEETALAIAAEHGKTQGLVAVLGRVEPCQTIEFRRDASGWWTPYLKSGAKCLHYYHYYLDPDFGLRYTRMQSWFPFTMHQGINGRDWLARQMTKAGLGYVQKENCFTWVEDFEAAQRLLDQQLTTAWPALLENWAVQSNPLEKTFLGKPVSYYWTVQEGEYATDLVFRTPEDLQRLYPAWIHQAYALLQSGNLLRYLNYRLRADGRPRANDTIDLKTTVKEFMEGTCVRHRVQGNLLKMYNKMGNVLRVETMLTDVTHFKVFRRTEGEEGVQRYLRLRKGVADLHRRAEVSQGINERYIGALATVEEKKPLGEVAAGLGKRQRWKGRSVRALNPLSESDVALLEAVNRGEFMLHGLRNQDVRRLLFADPAAEDPAEEKRRSAQVTRWLRLLRAHGLLAKIPKTHRYQVTEKGRTTINALLAARRANTKQLLEAA